MKFLILCATLKFSISTCYRIWETAESRTQMEMTINVYSLLVLLTIFFAEFCNCCISKVILDNFKILNHYTGKGFIYIVIAIIYLSPSLGNQQNYSAYLLLCVGLISIFADCKFEREQKSKPNQAENLQPKNY